jgi:hypothetical protein
MTIARLAWRSAVRRRRLLAWNLGVPLLLLGPVALSPAAAPHRVAVFGVFFVFFGTFGAAIPTVGDALDGWLDTVLRTGVRRWRWVCETVLAGAGLDALQLVPVSLVLVLSSGGVRSADVGLLAWGMVLALVVANVAGLAIAAAVRSLAEAALASAAVALLLLHYAGFFRTPVAGWTRTLAAVSPYRPLREGLAAVQRSAGGSPASDGGGWIAPFAVAAVLFAIAAAAAGRWTRRFEWPGGR